YRHCVIRTFLITHSYGSAARTMTSRRLFLQAGTLSSFSAISSVARAAPAMPPPKISMDQRGYALTNGVTARKRKDGTWVFWVRVVNLDQPGVAVSANLQIATDRDFQQLVDVLPVTLPQSHLSRRFPT